MLVTEVSLNISKNIYKYQIYVKEYLLTLVLCQHAFFCYDSYASPHEQLSKYKGFS